MNEIQSKCNRITCKIRRRKQKNAIRQSKGFLCWISYVLHSHPTKTKTNSCESCCFQGNADLFEFPGIWDFNVMEFFVRVCLSESTFLHKFYIAVQFNTGVFIWMHKDVNKSVFRLLIPRKNDLIKNSLLSLPDEEFIAEEFPEDFMPPPMRDEFVIRDEMSHNNLIQDKGMHFGSNKLFIKIYLENNSESYQWYTFRLNYLFISTEKKYFCIVYLKYYTWPEIITSSWLTFDRSPLYFTMPRFHGSYTIQWFSFYLLLNLTTSKSLRQRCVLRSSTWPNWVSS